MKKFSTYAAFAFLLLCTSLVAWACRSDPADKTGQASAPVKFASNWEEVDAPPTLALSTGLDNPKYLYNAQGSGGYYYVEAKAVASPARSEEVRTPLNLALVIDKSGSMAGGKLMYAKQAAKHVIDQLTAEDYVSVVTYDTGVRVEVTSNKVGDKALLKSRIDAITTGSNTNLCGGMLEGYAQVKSTYRAGYVNRVLLLSDGLANVGTTSVPELERIVKNKNLQEGITISTFGVGLDFNENLMTGIAENGSGNYYFIHNPEEISSIFEKELHGLQNVVAQNTELTITIPENVVINRVYGFPFDQDGRKLSVHLRDVVSGETKAVLVKFTYFGKASAMDFSSFLSYTDALLPGNPVRTQEAHDLLTLAASPEELGRSFNPTVKAQVVLYESNDNLERAMQAVDAGQFESARKMVSDNDAYLQSNMG